MKVRKISQLADKAKKLESGGTRVDSIKILNEIYTVINQKKKELTKVFHEKGILSRCGYYNQHSVKIDGEWITEEYPIPVITIEQVGDLGIDLSHIFLEIVVAREQALKFNFHKLEHFRYEVYGIENYLNDFYNDTIPLTEIKDRIEKNNEDFIGISFFFSLDEPVGQIDQAVVEIQQLFANR